MKLYISQADIDGGEPCRASKCAIAIAFIRATGLECRAGHESLWVPELEEMGRMSAEGSRVISLFDCNRAYCTPTVVYIFFDISAPEELQRDYVPSTALVDMVPRKFIPGKCLPQVIYAN